MNLIGTAEKLDLTAEQLRTLRHMLGINTPDDRFPKPYRDYYCANHDNPELHEMQRLGAVSMYRRDKHYEWFKTTEAGKAAALASHRTIRYGKAKRVYLAYLSAKDCFDRLSFKSFLTDPEFTETRRNA